MKEYNDGTNPIGGDTSEYECPECEDNMMTYVENGESSSDVSELGLACFECEFEVEPDELEGFCEGSSIP